MSGIRTLKAAYASSYPEPAVQVLPVKQSLFDVAENYGVEKIEKRLAKSFGLAIFAGAFIALAFVFYITVTTGAEASSWGLVRLVGGIAFSLGLILVVIAGGELFTSTVLSSVAWAQKRISTQQLLACWARVYVGNFIGAMLMVALIVTAQMHLLDGGAWGLNALHIADHKLQHSWSQAFVLGLLCNLMVCLGVWMTFSSKDALTKSILLILPVAMFVSCGFEHSIANLFMVPLGIAIKAIASPEFYQTLGVSAAQFSDLDVSHFVINNLIPVTLGNIVGGGLFVGIGYWMTESWPKKAANDHSEANVLQLNLTHPNTEQSGVITKMKNSIENTIVRDVMIANGVVLTPEMTLVDALKAMADNHIRVVPVADKQQALLGVVSEHDVLRYLWAEEFEAETEWRIKDIMQTEILTVEPADKIVDLIEFMTVDRDKLFPVTDSGMLTGNAYQSYEQRLKSARAQRPSVYPVVDKGVLCGVIRRIDIVAYLAQQCGTTASAVNASTVEKSAEKMS